MVPIEELAHADRGLDDNAVLALAAEQGRTVLTITVPHLQQLREEMPRQSVDAQEEGLD